MPEVLKEKNKNVSEKELKLSELFLEVNSKKNLNSNTKLEKKSIEKQILTNEKIKKNVTESNINLGSQIYNQNSENDSFNDKTLKSTVYGNKLWKLIINYFKEKWFSSQTEILKQNKNVHFSLFRFTVLNLKEFFCRPLTEEEKIFRMSEKSFEKEANILYILDKIQQFKKLKKLILNDNQLKAFNLIYKPVINLDDFENTLHNPCKLKKKNMNQKFYDNKKDLKDLYLKISKEDQHTTLDKNILKLIKMNMLN